MIVTVVAVMCKLMVAHPIIAPNTDCTAEESRVEEIVTDSDRDERVDFFSCQIGAQIGLADWKSKHPIYFKNTWRIARIKCVSGPYVIKGDV